jgi:hypothetical protein
MGRAIDMQNDIEVLKREVQKLNNIVRGMASELSEVTEVVFEEEEIIEEKKDGKKKANTKRTGKSNKSSDTADGSADTESE